MSRTNKILLVLVAPIFLAGVLGGCSPSRKPLSTNAAQRIQSLEVVTVLSKEGPQIRVQEAMTGGQLFGMVGALVDAAVTSSRQNSADEDLLELRAAVSDFDYPTYFHDALEASLDSATWPGVIADEIPIESEIDTDDIDEFAERLGRMAEDACLIVQSESFLSPEAKCLVVSTEARIFEDDEPVYSCHFTYFSAPRKSEEQREALAEWAADDGKAYREAMAEGVALTLEMLHRDLLAPDRFSTEPVAAKELHFEFDSLEGTYPIEVEGEVLADRDQTFLVRDSSGFLYAFSKETTKDIEEADPEPPADTPSRFKRGRG